MHTSGIRFSAALIRRSGTGAALLLVLPLVQGCKSNEDKTNDIVTDRNGYTKITHKPVGHPSYALSPNGCPATWAVLKQFVEKDGTRQVSCMDTGHEKDGVEVDYLLPGETVAGIAPQDIVNKP